MGSCTGIRAYGWVQGSSLGVVVDPTETHQNFEPLPNHLGPSLFGTIGVPTLAQNWLHAHFIAYVVCVALAIVLHSVLPSIFQSTPSASDQQNTGFAPKASIIVFLFLISAFSVCALNAQTVAPVTTNNLYGFGSSYNNGASPSVAGTAFYGHKVADNTTSTTTTVTGTTSTSYPTFAVSFVDILPIASKPFTVSTNVSAGVAQQLLRSGNFSLSILAAVGGSFTGTNSGWDWTSGAMGIYRIQKNNLPTHFGVWFGCRTLKSSVSNNAGYQIIPGGGMTHHF